jgi:hypothetical protein
VHAILAQDKRYFGLAQAEQDNKLPKNYFKSTGVQYFFHFFKSSHFYGIILLLIVLISWVACE